MDNTRNITTKTIVVTPDEDTVNMGGIFLRNCCVAIDCGRSLEHGELLRKRLGEKFPVPISYLVLTHCHTDHRGGIKAFKDTTVVASEETFKLMPKSIHFGKIPKLTVKSGGIINLQDEDLSLEIHHVGGHTPGSSFVYSQQEKVLFAGDLLFSGFDSPYPASLENSNPEKWITAVENMVKFDAELIVTGHGPELRGRIDLVNYLEFYKSLRELILEAINDKIQLKALNAPDTIPQYEVLQKNYDLSKKQYKLEWDITGERRRSSLLKHWYHFYKKFQE